MADIFTSAKNIFGITYDPDEGGYILPDGSMLDFTGRCQVGDYQRVGDRFVIKSGRDWMKGQRQVDHREIDWEGAPSLSGTELMIYFINQGAVRIGQGALNIGPRPLTASQFRQIRNYIEHNHGDIALDISDARGDPIFHQYYEGARSAKILGDIRRVKRPTAESVLIEESLEEKGQGTKMKKEFWRAELIGRLMKIEELKASARGQGATFAWRTSSHNNYYFWFSLRVGEDPRVCLYCDPTLSGSTRGWLSCRKLTSEGSLKNLPDSIEEWAREDLGDKEIATDFKQTILNLLKKVPQDLASAWAKVQRALTPNEKHDEETLAQDEAIVSRLAARGNSLACATS